jgi:hypothetical protein
MSKVDDTPLCPRNWPISSPSHRSHTFTTSSCPAVTSIPYGSSKSSAVIGPVCPISVCPSALGPLSGRTYELTINATPEGKSSCSLGRNAGPLLLLELFVLSPLAEFGNALVPAADVISGDVISSCTPSSSSSSSSCSSWRWRRDSSSRRRISSRVSILADTSPISACMSDCNDQLNASPACEIRN